MMSIKEISEAMKDDNVAFGVREVLKAASGKKLKKSSRVFVARDVRDETVSQLEKVGVEFEVLKDKEFISKELGLDFESEVFLIR